MLMNIFVTLDRNYLAPLRVMLVSLFSNNEAGPIDLWLAGDGLSTDDACGIERLCRRFGHTLHMVSVPEEAFSDAPIIRYYTRAMYYRLLAAQLLPDSLDKALYLDPDILVINSLHSLYGLDLGNRLFAAATHDGLTGVSTKVARIRLSTPDGEAYFNSGVLLMNLKKMREAIHPQDIFQYAYERRASLILPDQDILNGMFWNHIMRIDEMHWNYDARKYNTYLIASQNEATLDWVMQNTAILHFCGKSKPWKARYRGKFSALYKHYMVIADRLMAASDA